MFGRGDDDGIFSITSQTEARKRAPLRVTEAYWHALFKDGSIPSRGAVDPRGMESALENAFLLEKIAPGMAKIRVAGSHLSDLMGMDVTGMPLSTLIAAPDRDRFSQAMTQLFTDPAILRLNLNGQTGFGRPQLRGEMILMPLRSDFGEITRAIGALVTMSKIGRAPRRFEITEIEAETVVERAPTDRAAPPTHSNVPLRGTIGPDPDLHRSDVATGANAGQADAPEAMPARGHLRLVVSND